MDEFLQGFPVRNAEEETKLEFYINLIDYYISYNGLNNIKFRNPLFEYKRTDMTLVDSNLIPFLVIEFKGDYGTCTAALDQLRKYSDTVQALYYACIIGYSYQNDYYAELYTYNTIKEFRSRPLLNGYFDSMRDLIEALFESIEISRDVNPIDVKEYEEKLRSEAALKFELGRALRRHGLNVAVEYGIMRPFAFNYSEKVDLAVISSNGDSLVPIEVKAKNPGTKGFLQLYRYVRAFNSLAGVLAYHSDNRDAVLELYDYVKQNYKIFNIKLANISGLRLIDDTESNFLKFVGDIRKFL